MTISATIEKWTFAQEQNDCLIQSVPKTVVAQVPIPNMVITQDKQFTNMKKIRVAEFASFLNLLDLKSFCFS
jgi:hypothetical protein